MRSRPATCPTRPCPRRRSRSRSPRTRRSSTERPRGRHTAGVSGNDGTDSASEVARLERELRVQRALVAIGDAANAADDLQDFYRTVHETLRTLTWADNCYLALYDQDRQTINYPYFADAIDLDIPDPNVWWPFGEGQATGTTAYAL